jgi:hypothetical protein
MTLNQISVFVENKAGELAKITRELSDGGVNMRALSIAETQDFGVLRFIADDDRKAAFVLSDAGYVLSVTPVLAVVIHDEPGSLANMLEILADAEIDVEYTYAFLTPRPGTACMIFRVKDNDDAERVLRAAGIELAAKEDLL